ncbi:MAG: hypothetical protein KGZ86_01120, partial [Candidatus Latescibacteria bacterium]|nr:hypothetical protein [Candidatus Latescibacterota bacterium]
MKYVKSLVVILAICLMLPLTTHAQTVSYDLDISDNEQNLVGNTMNLYGLMGSTQQGYFRLINPNNASLNVDPDVYGNADFTSLSYTVDTLWYVPAGLEDISYYIAPGNVSLSLPATLPSGASQDVLLSANIPSDVRAGTYRAVVSVTGYPGTPGTPTDWFTLELGVGGFDDLDIVEASVSANGPMMSTVNTPLFTVWSTDAANNPDPDGPGNTTLYGVVFSATDLYGPYGAVVIPAANITFVPSVVDSIAPGTPVSVYAQVYVPLGTYAATYSGLATAVNNTGTTSDTIRINITVWPYYDLDIADNTGNLIGNWMTLNITPEATQPTYGSAYFVLINPDRPELNVDPDMFGNADLNDISYSFSDVLVHITNPLAWFDTTQVTLSFTPLHTLLSGASEHVIVEVEVPADQIEGTYTTWIRVMDNTAGVGDSFQLRVVVGPQEDVDIVEDFISGTATAYDTLVLVGTFTVLNPDTTWNPDPDGPGNIDLYNLRFTAQNLIDTVYPAFYIPSSHIYLAITGVFGPTPYADASIGQLALGDTAYVEVWVGLPYGTRAGDYQGQVQVQDDDGWPSDVVGVYLTVEPSYDLDISDNTGNLVGNWMSLS